MIVATAAATLAAAIIAGFALKTSINAQDSLNQQETQQNASKVYLGEAPKYAYAYAYDKHFVSDPNGNEVVWVVMNASDVQIGDTWIEGGMARGII
jgi:hypothetical protein